MNDHFGLLNIIQAMDAEFKYLNLRREEEMMKIISISGECGVGKNALADGLAAIISNSRHIAGDSFMFDSVKRHRNVVLNLYSDVLYDENGDIDYCTVYRKGRLENDVFIPYIIEHTSEQFDVAINQARKDGIEILILQWVGIHACACWKDSDVKVQIIARTESRHNALYNRVDDGCGEEQAKERDAHWSKITLDLNNPDIIVNNDNYSLAEMNNFTREICSFLQNKSVIVPLLL